MGWRLNDRIDLLFTDRNGDPDPRFDACEVAAEAVTIDEYTAVTALLDPDGFAPESKEEAARVREIAEMIMPSIIEWNLADKDGSPTPVTADGLMSHPKAVTTAVINAWLEGQRSGPAPLDVPSSDGAPTVEIPMRSLAS